MTDPTFERAVFATIAETFAVPLETISRATVADDVDGWDSLGHSILMTRLSRTFAIPIGEDIASGPENCGALADALARAQMHER